MRKFVIIIAAALLAGAVHAAEVGGVKLDDKVSVGGTELVQALMRIWLGEQPVQADLTRAMLGS